MKRTNPQSSSQSLTTTTSKRRAVTKQPRRKVQQSFTLSRGVKWGFPLRLYCKHRYVENVAATSTTGSVSAYRWRANGMFDPNHTGTGHQPMYYDVCATVYNHWTVIKSYAKFTFVPIQTYTTAPAALAVSLDDDTSSPATTAAMAESSKGQIKIAPPSVSEPTVLYCSFSAKDAFGGNPLSNDNLQGTLSADPTEQMLFITAIEALNASTQTWNIQAEITYYAVWDELRTIELN